MKERLRLELPPNLKFLRLASATGVEAARCIASDVGGERGDAFVYAVELAVSEVFTNAVKHGRPSSPPRHVIMHFGLDDGLLEISVKDGNPRFDLAAAALPDIQVHPESGYGLYLVKQVMDNVLVRRESDGNVVTMAKAIKPEDAA